jgi:hypothetical protein
MKSIAKLIILAAAAFVGAAVGDLARQRFTGEQGRVLFRASSGEWKVNLPPRLLIPAVLSGFRARERGVLRAAGMAALMAATGGKGIGGIAGGGPFGPRRKA